MSTAGDNLIQAAHRSQEWLRARPRVIDVAFAAIAAAVGLADLAGGGGGAREPDALGATLVLVGAAALIWRRRAPLAVLAFVSLVSCIFYTLDFGSFMAPIGLAAIYAAAAHTNDRRNAWFGLATATVVLLTTAGLTLLNQADGFRFGSATSMAMTIVAAIVVGAAMRNHQEIFADTTARAEQAEADRNAETERAVIRERLRIAREMHDIVAHGMSLVAVQSAAAQEVVHSRPDDAANLMRSVESTGREALAEMRRMLGVLRNSDPNELDSNRGELAPQPTLGDLQSTVDHYTEVGIPATLRVTGQARPLPAGIELAGFRVVQEALTNVVKHGGNSAAVTVELDYDDAALHINVADTGRGAVSDLTDTGAGHGLIGMRERVETYNGELTTGPRPGGGYRVSVTLPIDPQRQSGVPSAPSDTMAPS
jgi:signal transduction histidine kinase